MANEFYVPGYAPYSPYPGKLYATDGSAIQKACQEKFFELLKDERTENPSKVFTVDDHDRIKVQAGRETGDDMVVDSINWVRANNNQEPF